MVPSPDQIEQWAEDMGDGWTRLPTSSIDGILWLMRKFEGIEQWPR